ncbi:MAG: histone deacetylase [Candidatus Bipolaricaulota bacterium]
MSTGIVYDPIYLQHDTGNHPENCRRLVIIMSHLERTKVLDELTMLSARAALAEELQTVHTAEYIARVKDVAEQGGGQLDPDTSMSEQSYKAALYAAGGLLVAVESVMKGEVNNAFALIRPPGHHATASHAMGFCIFNNVAIAANFALRNLGIGRVLIVDFDVHHGNGTEEAFYTNPNVLYFSTHQHPFYPGTGGIDEIGSGEGEGTTVNFPMTAGWGDEQYLRAFNEVLVPVARRFRPQLILVSAGFDPHWADTLAMMQVSIPGFAQMVTVLKELATELCDGRLILALEGGYNLGVVAASVHTTFNVLLGSSQIDDPLGRSLKKRPQGFPEHLARIKRLHHISRGG